MVLGKDNGVLGKDYTHYADDPVEFIRKELGAWPWSKQVEVLEAVRDYPRVSVRSCHGVGKTFISAATAVWFLMCHRDSIVITTAPTARQVTELLWREIRGHHQRSGLAGRCLQTKWEIGSQWYAMGLATDDPTKFQGFHAEHILLICDEAAGIAQEIYDAADGILTTAGARQLLIGNPTTTSGKFHHTHHEGREHWKSIKISAFDSPNFTGEKVPAKVSNHLITEEWAELRKSEWGGESPLYRSRVLGEFPDQADDSLIALSWVEDARKVNAHLRHGTGGLHNFHISGENLNAEGAIELFQADDGTFTTNLASQPTVLGADIARSGSCENSVTIRKGPVQLTIQAWRGADIMGTVGKILAIGREFGVDIWRIDATGLGGAVADGLRAQGVANVEEIWVGSKPLDPEHFVMLRDEIWWNVRMLLQDRRVGPIEDPKLSAQLVSIKYAYDARGRIKVENKEDMRARGLQSPDRADSFCLAFMPTKISAVRPVAGGFAARKRHMHYKVR